MKKPAGILLLVFFAGLSFLIFEVSWFRLLSLAVGATVSASTLVLAGFMAGLGLGAFFWGGKGSDHPRPAHILLLLFTGIGVFGFLNYFIIRTLIPQLYSSLPEFLIYLIAFASVFIPAFLMGGVLPLASGLVIQNRASFGKLMGRIYAFETLGSALGGLAAGFILIGKLGQQSTIIIASCINILLAIFLFFIRKEEITVPETIPEKDFPKIKKSITTAEGGNFLPLASAFAAGLAGTGMQIIWMRFFRVYLTNTSYTFALISSMTVLGLFAGSWLYSQREKTLKDHGLVLVRSLVLMAGLILAGLLVLLNIHSLLLFPLTDLLPGHFIRIIVVPVLSSFLVILPVSVVSGFIFPLACTLYNRDNLQVSKNVGHVLLANTAGSVAGPVIAAFILIPLAGAALSGGAQAVLILLTVFLIAKNQNKSKTLSAYKWGSAIGSAVILMVVVSGRKSRYCLLHSINSKNRSLNTKRRGKVLML